MQENRFQRSFPCGIRKPLSFNNNIVNISVITNIQPKGWLMPWADEKTSGNVFWKALPFVRGGGAECTTGRTFGLSFSLNA